MFHKQINKKIALLVLLIIAFIGIWLFIDIFSIGPGLPSSEGMPGWYIPEAWQGNIYDCTSLFPKISPYCNSGKYSEGKFVNVWYFDDESEFLKGENTLYHYLEKNGNMFQQELNITTELEEVIERREGENSWSPIYGPYSFNATRYESSETSGYFLVYERPFLKGREDYFIAYYGINGTANLTEENLALKKMIAESYYMADVDGRVESLKLREEKDNSLIYGFHKRLNIFFIFLYLF